MKNVYVNFISMPHFTKIVILLCLASPALVFVNLIGLQNLELINALILSLLFSALIFVSGCLLLIKIKFSRAVFLVGWVIICLSPMVVKKDNIEDINFLIEAGFNILIGIGIFSFLVVNKAMKNYFSGS